MHFRLSSFIFILTLNCKNTPEALFSLIAQKGTESLFGEKNICVDIVLLLSYRSLFNKLGWNNMECTRCSI